MVMGLPITIEDLLRIIMVMANNLVLLINSNKDDLDFMTLVVTNKMSHINPTTIKITIVIMVISEEEEVINNNREITMDHHMAAILREWLLNLTWVDLNNINLINVNQCIINSNLLRRLLQ
jgi:hypothetical protein